MPTLTELASWNGYSLEELSQVAAEVAAALPIVGVVAVHGALGAGKTTLVRAVLQVWGTKEEGASPTFGLVHHHTVSRQGEPCQVRSAQEVPTCSLRTCSRWWSGLSACPG